jgi:hypothetical protein
VRITLVACLMVALAGSGCVTSTAHKLPLAENPLREHAVACEAACHHLLPPAPPPLAPCHDIFTCDEDRGPRVDARAYARCIDACPGVRVIDDDACPDPPIDGLVCVSTEKANLGGIAGGVVAGVSALLVVSALLAFAARPSW